MNPLLPQKIVDAALAEDLAAGRSEYLAEWRTDIASYIPRELVESLVVPGRRELMPPLRLGQDDYRAFVDVSGGRSDDAALCIAHSINDRVVVDLLRSWAAPHNPYTVVSEMTKLLGRFGLNRVVGDNYSAEFVASAFKSHGVRYTRSDKPKSQLYLELLPRLCSGKIELLDDPKLIAQLSALERRTRSGGRDSIDHPTGQHDDCCNALAGAAVFTSRKRPKATAFVVNAPTGPLRGVEMCTDDNEPFYNYMKSFGRIR